MDALSHSQSHTHPRLDCSRDVGPVPLLLVCDWSSGRLLIRTKCHEYNLPTYLHPFLPSIGYTHRSLHWSSRDLNVYSGAVASEAGPCAATECVPVHNLMFGKTAVNPRFVEIAKKASDEGVRSIGSAAQRLQVACHTFGQGPELRFSSRPLAVHRTQYLVFSAYR
jgi:hypothetical protein